MESELDIPSLTSQGIIMEEYVSGTNRFTAFSDVKELVCSSMIACFLMIEMLTLLINSFDIRVIVYEI